MKETFIKAFRANHSGFRGTCDCGREFYHPEKMEWDFEEDELKWLKNNATETNTGVMWLEFNGREYVMDCDCWIPKANQLIDFFDHHAVQIARYLNGERERKIFEAERVQIVKILSSTEEDEFEDEFDDDIPF